ncbi:Sulfotransferase domain-containing protein [Caenorhabditis elegans]|uniref:Sulfotransferase domain-containing protein n=1 Tax=Caenorhabditis elegans TaxID=6239 RepID=Q9XUV6_CAEEL|nr:Sulfotransferase domain-containing protein [Caenorhabditis elegans]CAB04541.2 Sulfotransferase domain-containing protein [Caenorhabditis elegans]|eukprot:NP_510579.2 Uncharacterized protein CELE_F59D12.3 [Caenorhabditis elegans]
MTINLLNTFLLFAILIIITINLSYFCSKDANRYSVIQDERFSIFNLTRSISNWTHTSSSPLIPPYVPFRSTFVTSPKYSLAACRIQKNLSTILLNLFCFLNTPRKFSKTGNSLTVEFRNHISVETCNKTHANHIAMNTTFTTKLAIIRDPVERFLSGFVDKCIHEAEKKDYRCYGCNKDMVCVLKEQYERFKLIAEGRLLSFSYEDRHFAPMSWFCDFDSETIKNYRFLFFGETEEKQSQTIRELMNIFSVHGVDNGTISHIFQELSANRTKHSTSGSAIREKIGKEMRSDPEAMRLLHLIYENDYRIFKLQSPFIQS